VEIVHRLARSLDADDYAAAKLLFEPYAVYETRDIVVRGVDAILASFRETSEWGRKNLDALEFSHEINDATAPFAIGFTDVLRHRGEEIMLKQTMHVRLSPRGLVQHLRLESPPDEQAIVGEFFKRHGLVRRPS
jgi:hypothetical protein